MAWHIFCSKPGMVQNGKIRFCQNVTAILIWLLLVPALVAQDLPGTQMVRYSPAYEFRDGIYINTEMIKANRPIPPARIVSDIDIFDDKFYDGLLKLDYILLYDDHGVRTFIKSNELWGYACNGVLFMQVGQRFHRLTLEGNISRFTASATTYEEVPYPPPNHNGYVPSYYAHQSQRNRYAYKTQERKVYLLDLETNTMNDYTPEDLGELLMRDSQLYAEYSALKRGERKKRLLEFIQRYNQSHPLYFPVITTD